MNGLGQQEVVVVELIPRPRLALIAAQSASGGGGRGVLRRKTVGLPSFGLPARVLVEMDADENIPRPVVRQRGPIPVIHIPVLGPSEYPGNPRVFQQPDQPFGDIQIGRFLAQAPGRPRPVISPAVSRIQHHAQDGSLGNLHVGPEQRIEGF